jgi:hypothetical protein
VLPKHSLEAALKNRNAPVLVADDLQDVERGHQNAVGRLAGLIERELHRALSAHVVDLRRLDARHDVHDAAELGRVGRMERYPVEDAQLPQVAEIVDAEIARGAVDRPSLAEQVLGEQAFLLTRNAEDESGMANGNTSDRLISRSTAMATSAKSSLGARPRRQCAS